MPNIPRALHYPLFLNLSGTAVLVIGAGPVAARKISGLLRSGAAVTVVAPQAGRAIRKWAADERLRWVERPVELKDLRGNKLVFCATNHSSVDRKMATAAQRRGLLVNCASAPELGNFILPAVARKGLVQIAVSTGGASPALARKLAREVAAHSGVKVARWARLLRDLRPVVIAKVPGEQRPAVWKRLTADKLGDMVSEGRMSEAKTYALMKINEAASPDLPSRRRTRTKK